MNITRGPVVQEDESKDATSGLGDGQRAMIVARTSSDNGAHFEFKIQQLCGSMMDGTAAIQNLPTWSRKGMPRDVYSRGSSVISDWQVQPIGLQGLLFAAKHDSDVGGVFATGIKVGVFGNGHG